MLELSHMNKLEDYLMHHLPNREEPLLELEAYAESNGVPIMDPVSMNFLTQLVRIHQPETILEIGTAIGYSALRMADAHPSAMITSMERNTHMYELATKNIQATEKASNILLKQGDALDIIHELIVEGKQYDFIFIDAAKAQYQRFFELVQPLTRDKTIIVCDNILFKGYVVDETKVEQKRLQSLTKKIQAFNTWLVKHPDYHTSIIPIGDGVSISVKVS